MLGCFETENSFVFEIVHRLSFFFLHVYVHACSNLATDQLTLPFCLTNSINRNKL